MKKFLPWIVVAIFAVWILSDARPPKAKENFNIAEFGRLPVLLNGRVQPFDSVGKNALLNMSGKSTVRTADKKSLGATEWLLEAMTRADDADTRK
ncbi:MAG: cytochrome C biogenesis protein, partial [Verrucomicrobiota bacterium]